MIDLHSHTTASDGTLSPLQLLELAAETGLSHLAITDHDTCAGYLSVRNQMPAFPLVLISGIELEITLEGPGVFHLLGLDFDADHPGITAMIQQCKTNRSMRNSELLASLQNHGLNLEFSTFLETHDLASIGRPHFADWLVKAGVVGDRSQAFAQYLSPGAPTFVPNAGLNFDAAIHAIHGAGGRAFLAHPQTLFLSWKALEEKISELQNRGLDGVEVWHPGLTMNDAKRLEAIAKQKSLLISAGSDYHGDKRPDRRLGWSLAKRRKIEDRFIECIKR